MAANDVSSDEKLMAAIPYWGGILVIFAFIPGLIIYLLKKDESPFIKKHALQATVFHVALLVLGIVISTISTVLTFILPFLAFISLLLTPLMILLSVGVFAYQVFLGIKAYQGEDCSIPMVTDMIADRL